MITAVDYDPHWRVMFERLRAEYADAVRWMGEAIDAHHRGDLGAPPRVRTDLGDGSLVPYRLRQSPG